jgi:hypothetical protein
MNTQPRFGVYHAVDPRAMAYPQPAHWQTNWRTHFVHVADVVAPFAQVFALTNTIDRLWTSNPAVVWYGDRLPLRSTSVGDVIVSYETEQAWMILSAGFHPL